MNSNPKMPTEHVRAKLGDETIGIDRRVRLPLKRGRIHWYSKNLGHGFIVPEDGGLQAFVRHEDIVAGEEENLEKQF